MSLVLTVVFGAALPTAVPLSGLAARSALFAVPRTDGTHISFFPCTAAAAGRRAREAGDTRAREDAPGAGRGQTLADAGAAVPAARTKEAGDARA